MKPFKSSLKQIGYFGAIAGSVAFGIYCAVSSPEQIGWTGFKKDTEVSKTEKILENGKEITVTTKDVSGKTLWDWLGVLGVPFSLALLGFWFQILSANQADIEKERAAEQVKLDKEIAESHQKEEMLQAYFDRLATLLIDKNLLAIAVKQSNASEEEKELLSSAVNMIRATTLSVLRKFGEDGGRKTSVIQFLMEAKIIRNLNLSLEGAYLSNADLSDADFRYDFSSTLFRESINLTYVNFSNANLKRVLFSNADLKGAIFNNANLSNADIRANDLTGAKLISACLMKANLPGADLTNADLTNADLTNANLTNAYLTKANLRDADLRDANLKESKLIGTDLSKARNLTLEQVAQAKLCKTRLPLSIQVDPNRDCKELGIELS
jgi:uncharacterized protein YjbI with pentapeptide repeats